MTKLTINPQPPKGYRNPYVLDLRFARIYGWIWFTVLVVFVGGNITDQLPLAYDNNFWWLTLFWVVVGLWIGALEKALVEKFEQFEFAMHGIVGATNKAVQEAVTAATKDAAKPTPEARANVHSNPEEG